MKAKSSFHLLLLLVVLALSFPLGMSAQRPTVTVRLWQGTTPPTDNGATGSEVNHGLYVTNVINPTLTVYVPEKCNGKAVISVPGGGYGAVWIGTEGINFAQRFLDQGITFAVLKYRLPNGHPTVPAEDLKRAVTIMRERADVWGGYTTLGVMGGSAGGHLAATGATQFRDDETRLDFQILNYAVTSFQDDLVHVGSRNALLGSNQSKEMIDKYSNELQVTEMTPRAFIMHAADDKTVTPLAATTYANALMKKGVYTSLHIYPTGDHGCNTTDEWEFSEEYWSELMRFIADVPLREKMIIGDEPFVVDPTDGKTYALNNLGKYEPYGVYEKVRNLKVAEPRPVEIEYIATTCDMLDQTQAPFINTGYTHTANTRVVMECNITSNRNFSALFGSRKAYATNEFAFFSHFRYNGWVRQNGAFGTTDGEMNLSKVVPTGEKIRIEADAKQLSIYKDGEETPYVTKASDKGVADGVCPLYIFNLNNNGTVDTSPAYMRLYSFKIYEGETLVRDYVPVATADGRGGLKDRLTDEIVTAANGIPFVLSPDAGSTVYEGKLFLNEADHKEYRYTDGHFEELGTYLKPATGIGTDYANLSNWSYDATYASTFSGISKDGSNVINNYNGKGGHEPLWYKLTGLTKGTEYNLSFDYSCSQWWSWTNISYMPFSVLDNENFTRSNPFWPVGASDGVIGAAALQEGATTAQPVSIDFTPQQDYEMLVLQFGNVEDGVNFKFQFANLNIMEYDIPVAYEPINLNAVNQPQVSGTSLLASETYSASGQRLQNPVPGINIIGGRKVIVK